MPGWDNFFLAQVGASAALAGLTFVGVSINLAKILGSGHLPNRAQEALLVLLLNLVLSSLFLAPGQSAASLGAETLGLGLLAWAGVSALHVDSFRRMDPAFRRRSTGSAVIAQATAISIWAAGIGMLTVGSQATVWLVPGLLLSYLVALANAWVLTVEINR